MSKTYDVLPLGPNLGFLGPAQAKALRAFAQEEGLDEDTIKWLAQISGRGYRPPTTAEGWRELWPTFKSLKAKVEGDNE